MAKYFYHVPLQKAHAFIKREKTELNRFCTDRQLLSYVQQLGKCYYLMEVESFITFFKIDKEIGYALKTISHFQSMEYIEKMNTSLHFSQFLLEKNSIDPKAFFYAFCYLYAKNEPEEFGQFIQKSCIHYHSAFQPESPIEIKYREICKVLAKNRKITLRESFGEEGDEAYFRLFIDGRLVVEERGKRIKTLRKKAYKKLFYRLIDSR